MSTVGAQAGVSKSIFFDLYGTLIDILTDENDLGVYHALSRFLSYHLIQIAPEELRKSYFEGIQARLKQSRELHPEVDVYRVFSDIMHRRAGKTFPGSLVVHTAVLFRSLTIRRFRIFPGVYDTLHSLAPRYNLALISDAQWVFTEPELSMLDLGPFFQFRILSSRMGFKKPDVRLFQIAMRKLKASPEESVYIGDSPQKDLAGAKSAGMKFVIFRSECKPYDGLEPDQCFYNYTELEKILNGLW